MRFLSKIILYLLVIFCSCMFLMPILWMISTSLKTPEQIFSPDIKWIPNPVAFENYASAFRFVDLINAFKNTVFIALLNVIGVLFSCSLAAYAFSVLNWRF